MGYDFEFNCYGNSPEEPEFKNLYKSKNATINNKPNSKRRNYKIDEFINQEQVIPINETVDSTNNTEINKQEITMTKIQNTFDKNDSEEQNDISNKEIKDDKNENVIDDEINEDNLQISENKITKSEKNKSIISSSDINKMEVYNSQKTFVEE